MDDTVFPAASRVTILPWIDPVVDTHGVDPRSAYVETFWLGVIGPTATWVMRRFAERFDHEPDGFDIDLANLARSMGLSYEKGSRSPFARALRRSVRFGLVQPRSDGFTVRRRFPHVTHHQLRRLPADVRAAHARWQRSPDRLQRLDLERRLISAGVPPRAAVTATDAAALVLS